MDNYQNMSGEQRFSELDRMATKLFETHRWKTMFAERYGCGTTAIQKWKEGSRETPCWTCVAVRDALSAKRLKQISDLLDLERSG